MKAKVWIFLIFSCALMPTAARGVRDRTFDVIGTVSADDGTPLQDVEVTLRVDPVIYEGIAPVSVQRIVTSKGAFIFKCLTHSASTKYSVTVHKDGYEPQTVSGTAPPNGSFTIRLRKVSTEDHTKPENGAFFDATLLQGRRGR
jgi:hypothetical protein